MANIDWSTFWIIIAILWALPWKSWALWRAAINKQKTWFISLIIIQSIGILPILYLFYFQKDKNKKRNKLLKKLKIKSLDEIFETRKDYWKKKSKKTK